MNLAKIPRNSWRQVPVEQIVLIGGLNQTMYLPTTEELEKESFYLVTLFRIPENITREEVKVLWEQDPSQFILYKD